MWWLILVLALYGISTHQRFMERTRLNFSLALAGRDVRSEATLDGKPVMSGERISLGRHTFVVTDLKTESFATNLFIWYGGRDFGRIDLKRATGTLSIQSFPRAARLIIRGPEFSAVLTNSSGTNLVVPSDRYDIEATFAFSEETATAVVSGKGSGTVKIAPRFGAAHFVSSHSNTAFRLDGKNNAVRVNGELPATIDELPAGDYELAAERRGERQTQTVWITAGQTNDVFVEYKYGAATLETEPAGARVEADGRERGTTPLTLTELRPGIWEFALQRDKYETVIATLKVSANETNHFQTNLVNRGYAAALRSARNYFDDGRYDEAAQSANEALQHNPDDSVATTLRREAMGLSHLVGARMYGKRAEFAAAVAELNSALESIPGNPEAKQLLAEYTKREADRVEAEKKRAAELSEQERKQREAESAERKTQAQIKELHEAFNVLLRGVEKSAQFQEQELVTTNVASSFGLAVKQALGSGNPTFKIVRFEQPRPDIFALQARQTIFPGYRDCFVVGSQVRDAETRILFKVLEYEQPAPGNLLGGLLRLTAEVKTSNQDPRVARENAERFEARIKEGVNLVTERIQSAMAR
jgi:tetratricopeptide (TPR) repeat protein